MRIFVLGNGSRPGVSEEAERLLPFLKEHCEIAVYDLSQKEDLSKGCVDLALVLGGYAFGASRARRFFSTPKTVRWVQRGTGVAMASAAVAVATR